MRNRRLHIAPLIVSLLIPAWLPLACSDGDARTSSAKGGRGIAVRTAPVTSRDVVYKVTALGTLEPEEMVQITAEVSGAAKQVAFQAGDRVTADKVLVRIDPDRYRLQAEQARATHRRAIADWKRAESDLARREMLAKGQLVAVEELTRARQETERMAADAAAADAAAKIAQQNLERASVRAPHGGQINSRSVETGQFVQVGHVLATLLDPSRLRLRFKISEAESMKAKVGQTVTFRVAPIGSTDFAARVYHVSNIADPATRQVEVLAWVDNPGSLKPGFFAEVTLATGTNRNALVVTESAIQASERGFVVYVVDGGKAKERPVKIGLRTGGGTVEIVDGLKPGEIIVTEGSDRLADGVNVQSVDAATHPAAAMP